VKAARRLHILPDEAQKTRRIPARDAFVLETS
jgi:hypothetical protein